MFLSVYFFIVFFRFIIIRSSSASRVFKELSEVSSRLKTSAQLELSRNARACA